MSTTPPSAPTIASPSAIGWGKNGIFALGEVARVSLGFGEPDGGDGVVDSGSVVVGVVAFVGVGFVPDDHGVARRTAVTVAYRLSSMSMYTLSPASYTLL